MNLRMVVTFGLVATDGHGRPRRAFRSL